MSSILDLLILKCLWYSQVDISSVYFGCVSLQFRRELWLGDLDWRVLSKQMDAKVTEIKEIVKVRGGDRSRASFSYVWVLKGYKDVKHNPLTDFHHMGEMDD